MLYERRKEVKLTNNLDILALLSDDHSDGVERDKDVVLNAFLALFYEFALGFPRVPCSVRAGRVPNADLRVIICFTTAIK